MPAGDVLIVREATGGETMDTNTLTDINFDTNVREDTDTFGWSDPTATCKETGHYLMLYNLGYTISSGSDEAQINSRPKINGTADLYGWSSGHLTQDGNDNNFLTGTGIIFATTGTNQTAVLATARADNNYSGTSITRLAGMCGMQILRLDDAWNYFRALQNTDIALGTSQAWINVDWETETEKDSGYTHSTATNKHLIGLSSGKYYLIIANIGFDNTGTTYPSSFEIRMTYGGTEIDGTRTSQQSLSSEVPYCTASIHKVIYTSSADDLVIQARNYTSPYVVAGRYVIWARIQIVELDDTETPDYCRLGSTSDQASNSARQIEWNEQVEVDSGSFSHSTGTNPSRVSINKTALYMVIANGWNERSSGTKHCCPLWEFRINGTDLTYGGGVRINWGNEGNYDAWYAGQSIAAIMELTSGDYIEINNSIWITPTDPSPWLADRHTLEIINLTQLFGLEAEPSARRIFVVS